MVGGIDQATFSISTLLGRHAHDRRAYSGDTTFAGSTVANPLTQTVNAPVRRPPSDPRLASSTNPSDVGETVTFTATVAPTKGTGTPDRDRHLHIDGKAERPVPLQVVDGWIKRRSPSRR